MIEDSQLFEKYIENNFKLRSLRDYRDIPEVKERILQDSLNGRVPDVPAQFSVQDAIHELERQIKNDAWKEQVSVLASAENDNTMVKPRRLFGLFRAKESDSQVNQAEIFSPHKRK